MHSPITGFILKRQAFAFPDILNLRAHLKAPENMPKSLAEFRFYLSIPACIRTSSTRFCVLWPPGRAREASVPKF